MKRPLLTVALILAGLVSAQAQYIAPYSGAVSRTNNSKMSDIVSVFDFIPVSLQAAIKAGTSTTDVSSYLVSMHSAVPAGVKFLFPSGQYNIGAGATAMTGRVIDATGVTFTGGGSISGAVFTQSIVCDGTATYTTAIATALANAGNNGIVSLVGSTCLSGLVNITQSGLTLNILPGTTLKAINGLAGSLIRVSADDVTLSGGGTIDGNRANTTSGALQGTITLGQVGDVPISGATVQNLQIQSTVSYAIRARAASNVKINKNYFTDVALEAINIEAAGVAALDRFEINGNFIDRYSDSAGALFQGGGITFSAGVGEAYTNVIAVDNIIKLPPYAGSGTTFGINLRAVSKSVWANNILSGGDFGYTMGGGSAGTEDNLIIVGGSISGVTGMAIEAAQPGVSISGVYINGAERGIVFDYDGDNYSTASSVTVKNTTKGGIFINTADYVAISGYTFVNNNVNASSIPLEVRGSHNFSVAGATIDGLGHSQYIMEYEAVDSSPINASFSGIAAHNLTNVPFSFIGNGFTVDYLNLTGSTFTNIGGSGNLLIKDGATTLGTNITSSNNIGINNYRDYKNTIGDFSGTGSPESAVTAGVGSTFTRTDGAAGATFYVKQSGTGNTGWAAMNDAAAMTGILGSANGGTGNGFTKFTGPTTSEKTFTLPDANATILTTNAAVTAAQGGTGLSTYAVGDLIYASATTPTLARLADVAVGSVLVSGGVNAAPAWSATPELTSAALGGCTQSSTAFCVTGNAFVSGSQFWGGTVITNATFGVDSTGNPKIWSGGSLQFTPGANLSATGDTTFSRASAGVLQIGTAGVSDNSGSLNLTNLTAAGAVVSNSATAGVGYATGAGGAVTQLTSRTTGVTLNTVAGAITLVSAAGSTTPATFTVTNSAVVATDTVIVNQKSAADTYVLLVTAVASGSFNITAYTTGGTTTEQPIINFSIIKGAVSWLFERDLNQTNDNNPLGLPRAA